MDKRAAEILGIEEDEEQCPFCGHIKRDWSDSSERETNDLGHKIGSAQLPNFREDRIAAYRIFRRTIKQAGATDFDQVEWRFDRDRKAYPAALFEMTRLDGNRPVPQSYLDSVLNRITVRDWQGRFAKVGAGLLGCKAWIVLFRYDLTQFWVYNLTDERGWWEMAEPAYRKWVSNL